MTFQTKALGLGLSQKDLDAEIAWVKSIARAAMGRVAHDQFAEDFLRVRGLLTEPHIEDDWSCTAQGEGTR